MPQIKSSIYSPPWYLFNGHWETVVPSSFRTVKGVHYERERINTPDGDFLDLDWLKKGHRRLVILSHGLEGSSHRPYIQGMAKAFSREKWDVLAWNCRSCSGEINRKLRFYHHGDTPDLDEVVRHALSGGQYGFVSLVGFSMGGSITLKYMGEDKELSSAIKSAVAFSVPVSLQSSVEELNKKGNGFYRKRFLKKLSTKMKMKAEVFKDFNIEGIDEIEYFEDFDNRFTAPMFGFRNSDDFYASVSSINFLSGINRPTLLVNALNDPFLGEACYPYNVAESNPNFFLETPKRGGHVGFSREKNGVTWGEQRAIEFIRDNCGC